MRTCLGMVIDIGDPAVSHVTWSRVEDGFHVGSRAGEFLGYVDRQANGRYLACDLYSRPVGIYAELSSAMRAVEADQPFPDGGPA